jgi:MFS family permease
MAVTSTDHSPSAFAPFAQRSFAVLWVATLISNIGTWMFNVTSGWLMAELSPSALMVALVQVATALPIFLFALPAGALGDIFDRRRILLVTQLVSAAILLVFAVLLQYGHAGAWLLLAFTFLTGAASAFAMPAWQAIVPKLVPAELLSSAIALNGVSINIARAIGPALGGFVLAAAGAVFTVGFDALSYLVVVAALLWWRPLPSVADALPRERLAGAMVAGVRFALRSPALVNTLVRALAFFGFASAYWALLPLIARDLLHGGPGLYGTLLTALGAGAVAGTFLLPALRKRCNASQAVALATVSTVCALLLLAGGGRSDIGIGAVFIAGMAWIAALSSFNVSAQAALPEWVRARGLAIFQMVFFGAMALGSMVWGQLAEMLGLAVALAVAAGAMLIVVPLVRRFELNLGQQHDFSPSGHWAEPSVSMAPTDERGPVLITLDYEIDAAERPAFLALIGELGNIRRRDGAFQWGVFENTEQPGHFIEMFLVESWVAHLRQHARVSNSDRVLQDRINALHSGSLPPRITHALAPGAGLPEPVPADHRD